MERVLIIEPHMSGHHGVWLGWLVPGLLEHGYHILIATLEYSLKHPVMQKLICKYGDIVKTIVLSDMKKCRQRGNVFSLVKREFCYRHLFQRFYCESIKRGSVDVVLVPYLDYCAYATGLLGSPFGETPWLGLVMRPAFHYRAMGITAPHRGLDIIKRQLFFRLLSNKTLKKCFTIDETLIDFVEKKDQPNSCRLLYLPDPIKFNGTGSREEARRLFGIPQDASVILVYGALTLRKGIEALLKAVCEPETPGMIHVMLAGKQDEEVKNLLRSAEAKRLLSKGRLHQIDMHIDSEKEYAVYRAADIVWVGYRGHYQMSGILVQAGMMALPVIACNEGVIGWLTKKHGTGLIVSISDAKEVARAIRHLEKLPEIRKEYGLQGQRAFSKNTVNYALDRILYGLSI